MIVNTLAPPTLSSNPTKVNPTTISNHNLYYISYGHGDVRILTDADSSEKVTYKVLCL